MKNSIKSKLKRRGDELYYRYFYNSNEIIEKIIKQYDNNESIDESICTVIFDLPLSFIEQIYELIMYYPNKLKEIKLINECIIKDLYEQYGNTILIMNRSRRINNVRSRLSNSAKRRSKENNFECDITSEDIVLADECIYLNAPLEYGNSITSDYSPSLDRIVPTLGYIKNNIQVISLLANQMKSSATPEQLKTFAKSILNG